MKLKIVAVGESGVGKSCMLRRYVGGSFAEHIPTTVGVDWIAKKISIGDQNITLDLWDTAGQERYRSIMPLYYRDAQGVLLIYDVTNMDTFKKASLWMENIKKYCMDGVAILIAGNKIDLKDQRQVTFSEGMKFAKDNNALFIEFSAKKNITSSVDATVGIKGGTLDDLFRELTKKILHTPKILPQRRLNTTVPSDPKVPANEVNQCQC